MRYTTTVRLSAAEKATVLNPGYIGETAKVSASVTNPASKLRPAKMTTGENHEAVHLQHLGSRTPELTVTVTPRSGEQKPLVDAFTEEGSGLPTRADAVDPDADWRQN